MNIEILILNRWTCAVIYRCDAQSRGAAVVKAIATNADLRDAALRGADLTGADLTGVDLRDAVLRDADLRDADLRDAVLRGVDLTGAVLTGADLTGAVGVRAPKIENIDAEILAAVSRPKCALEMGDWHTCETTHCRAGWAIHLAGEAGYMLQDRIGAAAAGALIYAASRPGVPIPNFYASNDAALTDLRKCAGGAA